MEKPLFLSCFSLFYVKRVYNTLLYLATSLLLYEIEAFPANGEPCKDQIMRIQLIISLIIKPYHNTQVLSQTHTLSHKPILCPTNPYFVQNPIVEHTLLFIQHMCKRSPSTFVTTSMCQGKNNNTPAYNHLIQYEHEMKGVGNTF